VPVVAFGESLELARQRRGLRAARVLPALRHHLEMRNVGVERLEEALVLGVVAGPLRIVAGEATDSLHRVPQ
jgi:hypothetical protein